MRITQNSMYRTQMAGLNDSLAKLQRTQEMLTSGKKLRRPSDAPLDSMAAMRFRAEQHQLSQYGANIEDGISRLNSADAALMSANPTLQRVRVLVVKGLNDTLNSEQRGSIAEEINSAKASLLQVANTQYLGRPVFGGTINAPHAFDPATGSFIGNQEKVLRVVSDAPGAAGEVNISIPGQDVTGTAGAFSTLFKNPGDNPGDPEQPGILDNIMEALRTDDKAALQTELGNLDQAMENLSNVQATIGARVNRLEQLQGMNGRLDDNAKINLSNVEDVDFVKAAMDLQIQSNAYQAALSASAKIIQPSLAEFLR